MRAVILACGKAHGFERPWRNIRSGLIEVDDKTILDHQIEALSMAELTRSSSVVDTRNSRSSDTESRFDRCSLNIHFIETQYSRTPTTSIFMAGPRVAPWRQFLSALTLM